jgi:DNA mismatch repair ATPase MutS
MAHPPLLFLLDELLSGTNSKDRAQGARAIVEHLVARGAIGMVTTHDLSLAVIADERGSKMANVHFRGPAGRRAAAIRIQG